MLACKERDAEKIEHNASKAHWVEEVQRQGMESYCNEYGTIYVISSDFGDRMTAQSMGLMFLLSEHF